MCCFPHLRLGTFLTFVILDCVRCNCTAGVSINWSCQLPLLDALAAPPAKPSTAAAAGVHEVTLAAHGRKAGAGRKAPNWNNQKTRSRLCSAALFEQCQTLLAMVPALQQGPVDAAAVLDSAADASCQQSAAAGGVQQQDVKAVATPVDHLDIKAYREQKQRLGQSYQQAWTALRQHSQSAFAGWLAKP
jgi:hypothetical protein